MNNIEAQNKLYCGIDISCHTIDVSFEIEDGTFKWHQLSNDKKGFVALLKLSNQHHFVMETTGIYHLDLCFYLESKQQAYSVVHALKIKRFIQMNLEQNKCDKKDAFWICNYGKERKPEQYVMPENAYFECKSLLSGIDSYTKEITAFTNKIHSLKKVKIDNSILIKSFEKIVKNMKEELKKLEVLLQSKIKIWHPEKQKFLMSIVGIGKRASAALIVYTEGFKNTNTYQQLISYAGLSPKIYTSGSSIKGKCRISKAGGARLRHILYMCALNAKKNNLACKQLYERLVANGKNKKVALIAVCNKLLKQAFTMVQNQTIFINGYNKINV
jgi:transposase